ncbi:myelin protein zero-like protein 1 isoform X1 [Podarcis lilfordi]|uniref:Myelin protein zero-like protein 1 isoform X1 n=1 Tax=Podarcis lilfordi TaxID=74358 RepID=A0AA35P281_9SAUR|nr:myelin protein zero-like protein 1 isoform X1 [Podarcis lilfordi]
MAAASTAAATGGPGKRKSSFPAGAPALCLALALALGHGARMASCSAAPEKTAVAVSSPTEIHVESGKIARLSCWFRTSIMISAATSVSWSYQALGSNSRPITFFYYSDWKAYDGKNTQFSGRSIWAGNLFKNDASIKIANMQPADNGTYFCDVKNPPDIVTAERAIVVKVLEKENMPASSGNISSCWLLVLQFCCVLASLTNYLF